MHPAEDGCIKLPCAVDTDMVQCGKGGEVMGILGICARIGLFVLLIVAIMLSSFACTRESDDIGRYSADVAQYKADAFMPALDSIGECLDVHYYIRMDKGIFPNSSLRLIVEYDEATFLTEKERLETAYTYLDAPQMCLDDYTAPVTEFSTAGFDFRLALFDYMDYPKCLGMVGISDETNQIAYLWHYSQDLDYICTKDEDPNAKMIEFVNYHFGMDNLE